MKQLRWQLLLAAAGLGLVAGLLVRPDGVPSTVLQPQPVSGGGVYSEAVVGAPRALNPLLAGLNPVDRDLTHLIFSGLIRHDALGRAVPELATWTVSADQLTYTFLLKPTITWHDGQPLTTEDVTFTLDLMRDPAIPLPADVKQLWSTVTVAVTGTQIIAFTLPEPFAPFLDYTGFGILPRHLLEGTTAAQMAEAPFNLQPVGSGPFRFLRWRANGDTISGIELEAFPDYVGETPKLAQVNFQFFPDADTALEAVSSGQVLGISRILPDQMARVAGYADLNVYSAFAPQMSLIFMNLRDAGLPFFREKRVRQALLFGLNRQRIVSTLLNGQAVVANSPILPGSWAYRQDLPTAPFDPQAAARLLDDAGWLIPPDALSGTEAYVRAKEGVTLSFTLVYPNTPTYAAIAQAAQADWANLGVRVALTSVEPAALRSQYLEPRAFQAILVDYSLAGTPDPDPYPLWHQTQIESGQNYSGLDDRITSQYLEEARITSDLATRARVYQSFQSRFADQVPALLLYVPVYNYGINRSITNVSLGALTTASDRLNTIVHWQLVAPQPVQGAAGGGGQP